MAKTNIADVIAAKFWHALKYIAGKECTAERFELLAPGEASPMTIYVEAQIGGKKHSRKFDAHIVGDLVVGHPETYAASTAVPSKLLIAYLLSLMPKTKQATLAELPDYFTRHGELPAVDDDLVRQADALLVQLRAREQKTRKGKVTFARYAEDGRAQVAG